MTPLGNLNFKISTNESSIVFSEHSKNKWYYVVIYLALSIDFYTSYRFEK